MKTVASIRIPVCNGEGVIVERVDADSVRARVLLEAPNATAVRKRKGPVVRILLESLADDSDRDSLRGNARATSHDHETDTNPEKVWTLKRVHAEAESIFFSVVNDLITADPWRDGDRAERAESK